MKCRPDLSRTGKMFGFQHWNLEPDIITLAKTLSGGYVPCGAIVARRDIYQKTFRAWTAVSFTRRRLAETIWRWRAGSQHWK